MKILLVCWLTAFELKPIRVRFMRIDSSIHLVNTQQVALGRLDKQVDCLLHGYRPHITVGSR